MKPTIMKRQGTDQEKIFIGHISEKASGFRMSKELSKLNSK